MEQRTQDSEGASIDTVIIPAKGLSHMLCKQAFHEIGWTNALCMHNSDGICGAKLHWVLINPRPLHVNKYLINIGRQNCLPLQPLISLCISTYWTGAVLSINIIILSQGHIYLHNNNKCWKLQILYWYIFEHHTSYSIVTIIININMSAFTKSREKK